MRSRLDDNRARRMVTEGAFMSDIEQLAISANFTMTQDMAAVAALDPASTGRNVTMYTPTVTVIPREHEIINISAGTGALTVKDPTGVNTLGTLNPGERGFVKWLPGPAAWKVYKEMAGDANQTVASQQVIQQYTLLSSLANAQVMSMSIPFAFKLISVGFRTRIVASTAAKLATLTAQVNGVSVTGGVVSLTTANQNVSGGLTAGTAITAGNSGTAGQTVGVLESAVTAFVEGDGYVEYVVQNLGALV